MTTIRFNTLDCANRLKRAGMEANQAEAIAQIQEDILSGFDNNFNATKEDIRDLKDLIHNNTYKIIGLLAALQAIFHFIK